MKQYQIDRKEMHNAVINYLDTNVAVWSVVPKAGEFKNEFSLVNAQIEQAQAEQLAAQVYVGKSKDELKSVIAHKADILNDSIEVFAAVAGDVELESKMAGSYSDLNRLRNVDFPPKIMEIIDAAEANATPLQTDYNVTTEQIDDLKADIDAFLEMSGLPRAYQIASVQATKSLEQLFTEANDILVNKLDKVMKIFKRRDPNFYNGYLAAREVVNN
jgi:hypothetical protein